MNLHLHLSPQKSLGVVIVFFALTLPASAQNTFIKAGFNRSSLSGPGSRSPLSGYNIGVGGLKTFSPKLSLKHELIFSLQGTKTASTTLRYYYLNVPALVDVKLGEQFAFNVGPQLGIIVNAYDKSRSSDITGSVNTLDLSFCLGFTYAVTKQFLSTPDTM